MVFYIIRVIMVYFFITNQLHYKYAFEDINNHEKNVILKIYHKLFSKIFNAMSKPILQELFYRFFLSTLPGFKYKNAEVICFTDCACRQLPKGFIIWLKEKRPETKMVLLLYNKVSLMYGLPGNIQMNELPNREKVLPFDKIFSYDLDDIEKLGFEYFEVYSKAKNIVSVLPQKSSVFYCGGISRLWKMGRFYEIDKVYQFLSKNDVICDFHLVFEKGSAKMPCSYGSRKRISYNRIIEQILNANVILEIVTDGKYGATFRYCEAIVYNRKLLTNNLSVKKLPFYDERYIHVFQDVNDIDIEWCKKIEVVDYGYKGEFSPRTLYGLLMNI